MKKLTLHINGALTGNDAKQISGALNDLSGIVAADVVPDENTAYAYAGDRLELNTASNAVTEAGYGCVVTDEEYLTGAQG